MQACSNWLWVATAFTIFAGGQDAWANRIDLTERDIPLQVTEDNQLSTSLELRTLPPNDTFDSRVSLTSEQAEKTFGFLIPGTAETTITLNGHVIALRPAMRSDSVVYPLFPTRLQAGENMIRVERAAAGPWTGTVMFSLLDGFEEAHFPFAEAEPETGISARETAPSASQDNYDVQWYDSTWIPRVGEPYMEVGSQVIMGAKALASISSIEVDFDLGGYWQYNGSMTIDAVDSGVGTPALTWVNLPSYDAPRMRINLPRTYSAGEEFQVRIAYHGRVNDVFPKKIFNRNAFHSIWNFKSGGPMIYSESQPYGGRRWWPCKDHPSDKATTTVQRIIVPNNTGYDLTAVSNGSLQATVDHGATTEFVWAHNYPIATYLVSIAVSEYEYFGAEYTSRDGQTTMPVGAYVRPGDVGVESHGYLGTKDILEFFSELFGEYPFLEEKYVTKAWGDSFGIEHQTCTSMPSGGLGNGYGRRNVHELAHQWFGNKVSYHDLDHVWLGEGFATYAEALFDERTSFQLFRQTVTGWNGNGPVVGPGADLYDNNNQYKRAARVLDMLRFYLGDAKFFQALKDYAATGYTTAVSQPGDDPSAPVAFQTVVEQSAGMPAGSLQQFFDQWLYSGGNTSSYASRPTYSYSASYDILTSSVTIRLKQTQSGSQFVMPVPFRLTAADNTTTEIIMPMNTAEATFPLGNFEPVSFRKDPDEWVLSSNGLRFNDVVLPQGQSHNLYSYAMSTGTNTGTRTYQKLAGTPPWLSVGSTGLLSGTPPAPGVYPVNVRMTAGSSSIDATFKLVVVVGTPPPPTPKVVVNEVSYERRSSATSGGEFVELRNNELTPVDISGWRVRLVSSSADAYITVTIPGGTTLATGAYYLIGNAAVINLVYPGAVDLNVAWNDSLTDSGPAGVVLETAEGARVDSFTYKSDGSIGAGSYRSAMLMEGGTGRTVSWGMDRPESNVSVGRLPDGSDTEDNLQDFANIAPSPGTANAGITLPFFDDFNNGARPEWRPAFTAPIRTATPATAGKPINAPVAPAGGNVLEVYDPTGGGDVNFLPGAFDKLNFEGYIWIPQYQENGEWSTGVGINTRVESAWFSSNSGYDLPNGFYLEYQNGPDVDLFGNRISNAPGMARLLVVDSSSVPGVGLSATDVTQLGTSSSPPAETWQQFRLVYDRPANRLYARLGETVLYNGAIPAGGFHQRGGISIGFRENHSFNISTANREGTWVDNIKLDINTAIDTRVEDFHLY